MKTVEHSQNRLIIEIRPVGLMILCVGLFLLFLILGFGASLIIPVIAKAIGYPDWMVAAASDAPGGLGMQLLGYLSVIPLLVGVLAIKTRRLTFDRAGGEVIINTSGALGRSEKRYPFAAFQGASLSSNDSDNSTTYRAMLHFNDENGVVPVTPYGTSGGGPAKTVNAINAWLGPRVTMTTGPDVTLTGAEADQAFAALEKLGIRIQR